MTINLFTHTLCKIGASQKWSMGLIKPSGRYGKTLCGTPGLERVSLGHFLTLVGHEALCVLACWVTVGVAEVTP